MSTRFLVTVEIDVFAADHEQAARYAAAVLHDGLACDNIKGRVEPYQTCGTVKYDVPLLVPGRTRG